jgi:hypothetical protein
MADDRAVRFTTGYLIRFLESPGSTLPLTLAFEGYRFRFMGFDAGQTFRQPMPGIIKQ